MKITFVGVGEAFDPILPNTSYLVEHQGQSLLIDCGFSALQSCMQILPDAHSLSGIYLTHLHADHCFGVPALITWMNSQHRTNPLQILGPKQRMDAVAALLDRAYPGVRDKLGFPLEQFDLPLGGQGTWNGWSLTTAPTIHPVPNHAIRIDTPDGRSAMFSGDGEITPQSSAPAQGVDLLVHEAYREIEYRSGHSTVADVLELARKAGARQTALVHMEHDQRARILGSLRQCIAPTPGTTIAI